MQQAMQQAISKTEKQYITERLVNAYGLWFGAVKRIPTPDFWIYMLTRHKNYPYQKFSDLSKITDDLANDIYNYRGDGIPVSVTAIMQPPHIQVTRSDRQDLPWEMNKVPPTPFVAALGAYWNGPQPQPLLINLRDDDYAIGAFFGSPGSGKSTLLHSALMGVCRGTPAEQVEIYAVDLKMGMFSLYERLPQVRFTARTNHDALDLLRWVESLCHAETQINDGKLRILAIDELQMLVADSPDAPEHLALLCSIFQLCREFGIRVLTATQNPNRQNYPPELKALTHYMGVGRTVNDQYLHNQMGIRGARDLLGKGDFLFHGPQGVQRFKGFKLDEPRSTTVREAEVHRLIQKWGDDPELIHFIHPEQDDADSYAEDAPAAHYEDDATYFEQATNHESRITNYDTIAETTNHPCPECSRRDSPTTDHAASVTVPPPPLSRAEQRLRKDALAIAPLMAEAWDDEFEDVRRGYGVKLTAAIYGEAKEYTGGYKRRVLDATAYYWQHIAAESEADDAAQSVAEGVEDQAVWLLPYREN